MKQAADAAATDGAVTDDDEPSSQVSGDAGQHAAPAAAGVRS